MSVRIAAGDSLAVEELALKNARLAYHFARSHTTAAGSRWTICFRKLGSACVRLPADTRRRPPVSRRSPASTSGRRSCSRVSFAFDPPLSRARWSSCTAPFGGRAGNSSLKLAGHPALTRRRGTLRSRSSTPGCSYCSASRRSVCTSPCARTDFRWLTSSRPYRGTWDVDQERDASQFLGVLSEQQAQVIRLRFASKGMGPGTSKSASAWGFRARWSACIGQGYGSMN